MDITVQEIQKSCPCDLLKYCPDATIDTSAIVVKREKHHHEHFGDRLAPKIAGTVTIHSIRTKMPPSWTIGPKTTAETKHSNKCVVLILPSCNTY